MVLKYYFRAACLIVASVALNACQSPDFSKLKQAPYSVLNTIKGSNSVKNFPMATTDADAPMPLREIIDGSLASKNKGSDFLSILQYAIDTDPNIITARRNIEAKLAVEASRAQKNFQVGSTLYGGIEDITDNTKGLALSVDASASF